MKRSYDFIAIGAGSAGIGIAAFMAKAGFKALLIDKSETALGGDCLNYGCVPSKALIHAARQVQASREIERFGISAPSSKADLSKVMDYVRECQEHVRHHESKEAFEEMGLDVALGSARFSGPNSVKVGDDEFSAKKIVLATGSSPRMLNTPGIENIPSYTNETLFDMDTLPERLLVAGGGPIGCELGQAFAMLGSKVTIVQSSDRLLHKERPEVSQILKEQFEAQGIEIMLGARLDSFSDKGDAIVSIGGEQVITECDAVLSSIGRNIHLESLDLDKAGIETQDGRIVLDEQLRTTNQNILACGDVAGGLMFSHAAELHVRMVINNLLSPLRKKLDTSHFSWVTFTSPEVATFGRSAEELEKEGVEFITLDHNFKSDDRAITDDYRYGKAYTYLTKPNLYGGQKILGGTMIAPNAGELIQELILTNSAGIKASAIFNKIYPYPTASRVNQMAMVNEQEKRLTPAMKKLFRFLYKFS
jgi:pyruvate/2-oxoglutarate dehydrogenase complex dihydrolipoamide dehydrogenase (E3) component